MQLLSLNDAISLDVREANRLYEKHLNPGLLEIYKILGLSEMDIESAEGVEIHLRDGRKILDFSSSIGVLGLGHNHPRIIAAEKLCHEMKLIDAIKVAPQKLQAALAYNLCEMLPGPLDYCFLTVSGAEAVEAGMKICERAQGIGKTKFITATGSFHGKTHGALAVTSGGGFQQGFLMGVPKENVVEVPYGDVEAITAAIRVNSDKQRGNSIIAILLEAIQGQDISSAPPGYLKEVVEVCREHDILTIYDEVKIGMGRTGTFCAYQIEDVVPDVVTLSKSLGGGKRAVGAMICSEKIFKKAYGQRKDSSLHTTTFGGLGESCAVSIETLNVLVEENLIEGAREKGEYLKTRLQELQEKYPGEIKELLGRGLFQGVRFAFSRNMLGTLDSIMMASMVRELYKRHDIIAHFSGSDPTILHIMPPLIVEKDHLDRFVNALDSILSRGLVWIVGEFLKDNVLQVAMPKKGSS
jgi:acetylornithine/succinyldiaminopimelate/putrescine aminotransferase